jgi:hypothetical protein
MSHTSDILKHICTTAFITLQVETFSSPHFRGLFSARPRPLPSQLHICRENPRKIPVREKEKIRESFLASRWLTLELKVILLNFIVSLLKLKQRIISSNLPSQISPSPILPFQPLHLSIQSLPLVSWSDLLLLREPIKER